MGKLIGIDLGTRTPVFSIKRFMGRRYDEVQQEIKLVPYKVVKRPTATSVSTSGASSIPRPRSPA